MGKSFWGVAIAATLSFLGLANAEANTLNAAFSGVLEELKAGNIGTGNFRTFSFDSAINFDDPNQSTLSFRSDLITIDAEGFGQFPAFATYNGVPGKLVTQFYEQQYFHYSSTDFFAITFSFFFEIDDINIPPEKLIPVAELDPKLLNTESLYSVIYLLHEVNGQGIAVPYRAEDVQYSFEGDVGRLPLPSSFLLFGAALLGFGGFGYGMKRKAA